MAPSCVAYEAEGWGVGELWFQDGRLLWHELPTGPPRASSHVHPIAEAVAGGARERGGSVTISELAARLSDYFAGQRVEFTDIDVDLDWTTPFQLEVAAQLRAVGYGETVTYGELAALAGYPGAQRATGTFCAKNRFPIVLPCHRVVGVDGLGSYGTLGVRYKRRLLELEHAL